MPEPRPAPTRREPDERSVSELVVDVAEKSSTLVREEIELAKTEVSEKVGKLLRGSVVGIAAGTFAFLALILVMEGIAWLLARRGLRRQRLARLLRRGRRLPPDRRPRRLDRLPRGAGRLPAGARAGDRGGQADQGNAGIRSEGGWRMSVPEPRPSDRRQARPQRGADPPRPRPATPRPRHLGRAAARPRRRARPTGAARWPSTARS